MVLDLFLFVGFVLSSVFLFRLVLSGIISTWFFELLSILVFEGDLRVSMTCALELSFSFYFLGNIRKGSRIVRGKLELPQASISWIQH